MILNNRYNYNYKKDNMIKILLIIGYNISIIE